MLKGFYQKGTLEAGCDEAGRGCLAGPVFAAAVILPEKFSHPLLNDSKKMSDKQRKELRPLIEEKAIAWAVGIVSVEEIDAINILQASFLAMHRAITQLKRKPELLLIDGNRFKPYDRITHQCIIGGDGKYKSIAAASVLAKTYRDDQMDHLHELFPCYSWIQNKGYGTLKHRDAIRAHGACIHHRKTFQLLPSQIELTF
ncbi:MAG TPA: ribonuclease HII [Bacteroidia bacterium]|jgi:ribonuclease HII|nr:ribonuclease HII [Bacteroidia bacterium]